MIIGKGKGGERRKRRGGERRGEGKKGRRKEGEGREEIEGEGRVFLHDKTISSRGLFVVSKVLKL